METVAGDVWLSAGWDRGRRDRRGALWDPGQAPLRSRKPRTRRGSALVAGSGSSTPEAGPGREITYFTCGPGAPAPLPTGCCPRRRARAGGHGQAGTDRWAWTGGHGQVGTGRRAQTGGHRQAGTGAAGVGSAPRPAYAAPEHHVLLTGSRLGRRGPGSSLVPNPLPLFLRALHPAPRLSSCPLLRSERLSGGLLVLCHPQSTRCDSWLLLRFSPLFEGLIASSCCSVFLNGSLRTDLFLKSKTLFKQAPLSTISLRGHLRACRLGPVWRVTASKPGCAGNHN